MAPTLAVPVLFDTDFGRVSQRATTLIRLLSNNLFWFRRQRSVSVVFKFLMFAVAELIDPRKATGRSWFINLEKKDVAL